MTSDQPAVEVFIGLGSNLGRPRDNLLYGLRGLENLERYEPLGVSSPYLTAPVGPQDQPPFWNAVARGRWQGRAGELLADLQAIERACGRRREEERRWGPRVLDLDLLVFGPRLIRRPELVVPHPRLAQRAFVLVPLMELAPELVIPGLEATPAQLYRALPPRERAAQGVEQMSW